MSHDLVCAVVLLDGSQPMRYGLKLALDDKYRQLKTRLSTLCGLESGNILLVEVYAGVLRVSQAATILLKKLTKIRQVRKI